MALLQSLCRQELTLTVVFHGIPANVFDPGCYFLESAHPLAQEWLLHRNRAFTQQMHDEGYLLAVEDKHIILIAATERGFYHAVQSLGFLIRASHESNQLPALIVQDWPDFTWRGVSDDISRGQVSTLENFKRIIDFMAQYKLSIYMPYLEDLFPFQSYPTIGNDRGLYTIPEWIELQDYAQDRFVEIIPIFQTLGHYENLLLQSEFQHLAEFPGAGCLNVTDPKVLAFLEKVLAEIAPVFRSEYFHMGADESWDVGKGASRAMAQRHGIAVIHAQHYQRVADILKRLGKKVLMYGDIVLENPTILQQLPSDIILMDWHYDLRDHYESTEIFCRTGRPFIVSSGLANWSRIFPDLTAARVNISQLARDGWKNGAMGMIVSSWGDFGGGNLRELNYYGYAFGAECAWNADQQNVTEFEDNFFQDFYGSSDPGFAVTYHALAQDCQYYDLNHFYGCPFYDLPERKKFLIRRAFSLPIIAHQARNEIARLRLQTKRNGDHLDLLDLCAEMQNWVGRLAAMQLRLYDIFKYAWDETEKHKNIPRLQSELTDLQDSLSLIKMRYQNAWLATNRSENLHRILNLMNRVLLSLQIKREQLDANDVSFWGRHPAAFISHPNALQEPIAELYLRRHFQIDQLPGDAWLQVIADSHAKVWLNRQLIGEVVARRSLSAIVEEQRVRAWPVGQILQKGDNIIAIQVNNYLPDGKAAANVWFEAWSSTTVSDPSSGGFLLMGDPYWKACHCCESHWQFAEHDDRHWLSAQEIEWPWIVSRPFFKKQLGSRIEFYRKLLTEEW